MPSEPDPYRTLELANGASIAEVKRAYRRLAKIHHPDAAGERALPRFLAIQAAYEQLIGGAGSPTSRRRTSSTPPRPWEADPDRSDATRRAYGGRARGAPPGGSPPPGGATGSAGATGATGSAGATGATGSAGATGATGSAGATGATGSAGSPGSAGATGSGGARSGSARPGRRRRSEPRDGAGDRPADPSPGATDGPANKATLGSTSYDGADATPFEPDWGGASWYGTTSGTYWTLNPKEYADPRKHGPEYQARARRATRASESHSAGAAPAGAAHAPAEASSAARDPAAGPTHTTSSWWDSTAGAPGPDRDREPPTTDGAYAGTPPRPGGARPAAPAPAPPTSAAGHIKPLPTVDLERAAAEIGHALTGAQVGSPRSRVARAIVGWLPIAYGLGWVAGELTGCGRFAAGCDGTADWLVILAQAAVLAVLLLVPSVASIAATAALILLATAPVAALALSSSEYAPDREARQSALGVVLLVAWLVGVVIGLVRRARVPSTPTRPVS